MDLKSTVFNKNYGLFIIIKVKSNKIYSAEFRMSVTSLVKQFLNILSNYFCATAAKCSSTSIENRKNKLMKILYNFQFY